MPKQKLFTTHNMILCALFMALTAAGAFIRIPIPVIPFTLQFFFTNLAGLLLGRRLGFASVGSYVLLGLAGLPIFTAGGGLGYIFQPTFGYLLGFPLGAWLAGYIAEKADAPSRKRLLAASFANLAIVYGLGMLYYYWIAKYYLGTPVGAKVLLISCCAMTIPGDILLILLSITLTKRLRPLVLQKGAY